MKAPMKIVVIIMVFVVALIGTSMTKEWDNYQEEMKDMETFIQLAAEQALAQQQDLYLAWNSTGNLDAAVDKAERQSVISTTAAAEIRAATLSGSIGPNNIRDYVQSLTTQMTAAGLKRYNSAVSNAGPKPNETDMFNYLEYMERTAAVRNENYNPLQFGLSYIDPIVLKVLFEDNLMQLVNINYGNRKNNDGNPRRDGMEFGAGKVTVSPPQLIDLTAFANSTFYSQLFGVGRPISAGNDLSYGSSLEYDAFSNYIVRYTLTFQANGWHNMSTSLGVEGSPSASAFGTFGSGGSGDTAQWRWNTVEVRTRNAGSGSIVTTQTRYVAFRLPVQSYNTDYILMN